MRRSDFAALDPLVLEIDGQETEVPDYPTIAVAYAKAAADGKFNVCRWIKLAAKRYLRMLEMAEDPRNEFIYSPEHVVDYCAFLEKLRHFESGLWELSQIGPDGRPDPSYILEPWQIWIESAIHGFRRRITGERLVSTALEVVPRKNAKSQRAAGAALYDLCCSGQIGPEIPIGASSAKQADETLFGDLIKIVGNEPELVEKFGLRTTKDDIRTDDGRIFKLTSLGERQDGLNPSLALFEEGHAGAASVYKVIDSAFGARPNALRRMITTAGYRPEGPGYELQREVQQILEGKERGEDYTIFGAIYTLDEEDYRDPETKAIDWDRLFSDDSLLEKSNPMFGISLDPLKIKGDRDKARRRPDLRGEFARTRFNIWTGAGASLIELAAWNACKKVMSIDDFIGQGYRCWIGVDLAQVLDMCAVATIFEVPEAVGIQSALAVFVKYFLPEGSPTALDPDMHDQFVAWAEEGWLTLTEGPLADHERVREEVEAQCEVFHPEVIACDPAQAHNTVKYLWDGNRPVLVYPNNQNTMTAPTDDILGRIVAGTIWHDGNPVLAWNAANVHGDRRGNGKILPRKESENSKRKIDGFVAICMANGCRLQPQEAKTPSGEEKKVVDPLIARGSMIGYGDPLHG